MSEKRILAVEIDNTLFDELDEFVKNNGLSKKQYVAEVLRENLAQHMKQEQEVAEPEITIPKTWDRPEVEKAIDDFIIRNGRVPTQKEFKNENGLPSYGAASRALEDLTASEYANQRYNEINNIEQNEGFDFGQNINI